MPVSYPVAVTTVSSSAGTTATVNLPTTTANSTRIIIALALNTSAAITTPSGWTLLRSDVDGNCRLGLYYNSTGSHPASVAFTIGSSDWAAIATAHEGAHYRGFLTFGNAADFPMIGEVAEASTDTTITSTSMSQGYSAPGSVRLSYNAAVTTTAGWSVVPDTGTMTEVADVTSSGATPVQLSLTADDVSPPVGNWTTTGTSGSSADKVCTTITIRPHMGIQLWASRNAASSSAGTSGSVTTDVGDATVDLFGILRLACNSASVTFTAGAEWTLVDSTTTGTLHVETYISLRDVGSNGTLNFTLSGSADWTADACFFTGVMRSLDSAVVFKEWHTDVDTVNDAAITATTMTASEYGQFAYCMGATQVASSNISSMTDTFPNGNTGQVIGNVSTSSGTTRIASAPCWARNPLASGDSGAFTVTGSVSSTEKATFSCIMRPDVIANPAQTTNISLVSNVASRW